MSPHWVNAPHQEQAPITEMSTSCFKKGKILFLFSSNPPGLHLPVLHFSCDVEEEVRGTSTLGKMAKMSDPICLMLLAMKRVLWMVTNLGKMAKMSDPICLMLLAMKRVLCSAPASDLRISQAPPAQLVMRDPPF